MMAEGKNPIVAIVMGSDSDWPIMKLAAEILDEFDIEYESKVVSAHRTPDMLYEFAEKLSPEDRENLARAVAGSMNYIKRMIQINSDLNDSGIQLTEQIMQLISKDSLKSIKEKALEYEKGDIINASQQKRGKIIDLKKEEIRHKDLKSKAENHQIITPTENNKKAID